MSHAAQNVLIMPFCDHVYAFRLGLYLNVDVWVCGLALVDPNKQFSKVDVLI